MSSFAPQVTIPIVAPPDPTKHVNYTLGMVLGVDDFTQEFAYLSGRDQWLARDLLGYGTVCGLRVSTDTDSKGPRVSVEPGNAVNPRGRFISVPSAQCAYLNDWLAANKETVNQRLVSPPQNVLKLYVTLCYRECPTDPVPIPGEPCRSEDESMAPSRLKDDYQLELSFDPPDQSEEEALRQFVSWLHQFEITNEPGTFLTLDEFEAAVRNSLDPAALPLVSDGSPPQSPRIHTADACLYLRTAFRIWTTELRPVVLGKDQTCAGVPPDEECVLLAELDVPVLQTLQGDWLVDGARSVAINEEHRPFLIHLRMLQEYLLCGLPEQVAESAPPIQPSNSVAPEAAFGQSPNAGTAAEYSRGDHTHGTPVLPVLAGDVTGKLSSATVERLHHVTVAATAPAENQVLTFTHSQWRPADLPPTASGPAPADTVAPETAFGQAAAPGTAAAYSRADHTHGTPPAPAVPGAGNTVTAETSFGLPSNAGQSSLYSRADHTHGSPPAPTVAGDFVEHPKNLGRYSIVAAGIVSDQGSQPPIYNGLIARVITDGQLAIAFDGYTAPGGSFQYIVKALLVYNATVAERLQVKMPIVTFDHFEQNRLVLYVTDSGKAIPANRLNQLQFMIEVSQFFK